MAQDTNDDFHHELHAVTNPAPRIVTPQLGVLFHAKQRTGNTRAGTSTSIKVSFIRSGPARTSILFVTCRLGVSAQQGKGPSPIVLERFQSVASQLMSQVRMDCDLNFSREVS